MVSTNFTNPFKPAASQPPRCKLFGYGETGVGKTRLALQFPNAAVMDFERGTAAYAGRYSFDVLPVSSLIEAELAVNYLATGKHEYRTLVIDPITVLNEMFVFRSGKAGSAPLSFQDWDLIKKQLKKFMLRLLALDMNLVAMAREKALYAEGEVMRKVGTTWDGDKSLASCFDTVLHLTRKPDGKRVCTVIKDRWECLKTIEIATDYAVIRTAFGASIERPATEVDLRAAEQAMAQEPDKPVTQEQVRQQVNVASGTNGHDAPATDGQVEKLRFLFAELNVPDDVIAVRLASAEYGHAAKLSDLSFTTATIIIGKLEQRLSERQSAVKQD